MCPFDCTTCWKWEGWVLEPKVNLTGWMTVVAPTGCPKSVNNRCVIERFCSIFMLLYGTLLLSVDEGWLR